MSTRILADAGLVALLVLGVVTAGLWMVQP